MEALIYARFSRQDQERGHTIERQIERTHQVCAARGLSISPSRTFVEKGKSAFSGANRRKGSLLANLELEIEAGAHHGRTLVVEHLDRISRQGHDEVRDFLRTCSDNGVSVATKDGDRFYPAGERVQMIEVIEIILKAELAREESQKKSGRVRDSFRAKREKAVAGGEKRIASRPPSWLRRIDGDYEIIEEHADIVREAHRLAQIGHGTTAIAKIFNDRNYRPWREASNGWHESYISRMLSMRTSIGEYVSDRYKQRIVDYYPSIITVDCYNRTQAARAKRTNPKSRGRRGSAQSNVLQSMVRCHHCGGSLTLKTSRRQGEKRVRTYLSGNAGTTEINTHASYLICVNSQRRVTDEAGNRVCQNRKHVRYERLEKAVLDMIMTVALDNDRFNVTEISQTRIELAETERQISGFESSIATIAENLKIMVSPTLLTTLADLERKVEEARQVKDRLAQALSRERGSQPTAEFLQRIKDTRAAMASDDKDIRRDARTMVNDSLKEIVSDISIDSDGNAMVIVAHGLAAFRVNDAGDVVWKHDSSNDPRAIEVLTTEAYASNEPVVTAVLARARRGHHR